MRPYSLCHRSASFVLAIVGALICLCGICPVVQQARAVEPAPWPFFGNDISNSRGHISGGVNVGAPFQINPRTASKLALKWSYSTVGDISATPTVEATGVYFPDYAGYLYKLDPNTGALLWSASVSSYVGAAAYSRSSPAIGAMGEIVIGDNSTNGGANPGARVVSVNKASGAANWVSVVETNPNSLITASPVIYGGRIFVGVASREESLAASVAGFVPSFRGSIVALDEATGQILWKFYTVPSGYTGAAVWGSNPVIWPGQQALIFTTGNNYTVPSAVLSCYGTAGADLAAQYRCMDPTNYVDSVVSLNLADGTVKWSRRFAGGDTWTIACSKGPPSECPNPSGQDTDFASAPNLSPVANFVGVPDDRGGTSNGLLLGAGEKSGMYWGLNPANGGLFWSKFLGNGMIMWGSALDTDDHAAVYVPLRNAVHYTNTLAGQNGNAVTSNGGAWASLDIRTGNINWQVPAYGSDLAQPSYAAAAPGPLTFTNRVLFAGATSGYFVCMNAASGNVEWTYNAGGSVIGGPSIYNETMYWGAGSKLSGAGSVHTMFAFWIPH